MKQQLLLFNLFVCGKVRALRLFLHLTSLLETTVGAYFVEYQNLILLNYRYNINKTNENRLELNNKNIILEKKNTENKS